MLSLYRRHQPPCNYRSRRFRNCKCPIWVQGSLRGEYVRRSLDLRSWEAANELVQGWEASGEIGVVKPDIPTVSEAVKRFFADAEARNLRPATLEKHRNILKKRLLPWCEKEGWRQLRQLDPDTLRKFRETWKDSPLTAGKNLERLRTFFRFCHDSGWISRNPAKAVRPPRVTAKPTLPFTPTEMKRILAACDEYPEQNSYGHNNRARVKAFVLLLRYSGLRIRDVACLERKRVEKNRLFLYTQKTGTPVYVPLPPQGVEALKNVQNGKDYFFWTGKGQEKTAVADWQRSLRRLFKIAKVKNGHAHRMRDTFAVELLLAGVPIEQVSVLLGHSSVKVTERHYSPWVKARQENLEKLVKMAW